MANNDLKEAFQNFVTTNNDLCAFVKDNSELTMYAAAILVDHQKTQKKCMLECAENLHKLTNNCY